MRQAAFAATRRACMDDLDAIRRIYNQGIEDRLATLETGLRSFDDVAQWWDDHEGFPVLVAIADGVIVGWASLNRFSHRCAHAEIADLSVYVARSHRGRGVGFALLRDLESQAIAGGFHKIVLHALTENVQRARHLRRKTRRRDRDGENLELARLGRAYRAVLNAHFLAAERGEYETVELLVERSAVVAEQQKRLHLAGKQSR